MRPKRKIQMIQQKNVTIDFQINKNITAITSYSIVYFQQVSKQAKIRRTKTKNNLDKKLKQYSFEGGDGKAVAFHLCTKIVFSL